MEFTCVRTTAEWDALALEWEQLYERTYLRVPFLRVGYLRAWWQTLGGAEWHRENSSLRIITAREGGRLIGTAPFFLGSKGDSQPALRFIGSVEVSDYLDFLAAPEALDKFLNGLFAFLRQDPELGAYPIELFNLREDSLSMLLLPRAAELNGYTYAEERLQPAPYIPLAESWEAYLAGITKKQRHEIRRKSRNAENRHQTDWYLVQDGEKLEEEVDSFISMMRKDPRKESFLNPAMREHLLAAARWAFGLGQLHLAFLTFEGHKAAAYFSLNSGGKLWVYNSAWEPAYAPCSPGWVLLAKVLQWSITQGLTEVDMMRGSEDYKYKFGAVDRYVTRVLLHPAAPSRI